MKRGFSIALIPVVLLAEWAVAADRLGPLPLKVAGNRIETSNGKPARLRGVDIPSLEWGQGEHLSDSLRVAIDAWGANIIRLPLSEDRWFGRSKEKKDEGAHYRKTVHEFVEAAAAKRCYVILDLHFYGDAIWGEKNGKQHKMAGEGSVEFWMSVSAAYANDPAVLFGLYNEPHDVSWETSRNGGSVAEEDKNTPGARLEYHTPGMQKLLNVCRAKGARNVVVAGGLDYAYDLSGVAKGFALDDPKGGGVVYDTHIYPSKKDFEKHLTPTAQRYAVLVGELGNGPSGWLPATLAYIDKEKLPWIAWSLHTGAKPCLIKDWKYEPTTFGQEIKKALRESASKG